MNQPIKILIADDHEAIIYFVSKYISQSIANVEVSDFKDGESVIKDIDKHHYDIYILDIQFRDMLGFELIKCIRKVYKNAKIIVFTMHNEMWFINELKHMAVNGIILKSSPIECLKDAIIEVYNGGKYYCGHYTELNNPYNLNNPDADLLLENFSKKDLEVLQFIAEGYTTKEIALKMGWSEETVKSYRKNRLLKGFNVKNPASLVARAALQKYIRKIKPKGND
ncbi:DNA-binding NarL/FixJ family response regulator [Dysgonomonas alginatilytica]|uniref:DNA-binding NarL/FixJ family response regulator n=1 Tax=Dysgonomonas alginatilytica TaxID=1605892 RepID=A0A2V3PS61_9BACT|nr:response regulator transcription factor [Dysgonomonas alginatilytica]PXV65007.1 DNA-binding NarL/FixJ family response regulator [Dysgonomonas alginatilytica]